jgi:hypothetical protein
MTAVPGSVPRANSPGRVPSQIYEFGPKLVQNKNTLFITNKNFCEGRKELAHTMVRRQLILFSKRIGEFLVPEIRTYGGFLHVPTQIYCLTLFLF